MRLEVWHLHSHQLLLPKQGAPLAECEDAIGCDDRLRRYAIADGATEAFDARGWAERLARGWITTEQAPRTATEFIRWAQCEGAAWEAEWRERNLPWYAAEKRRAGSFAAFVGIEFTEEAGFLGWRAAALGDACLILVRAGRVAEALPIADYRMFNSTPRLLPSLAPNERLNEADICLAGGTVEAGDVFWLLSDALAQWCLRGFGEESPRVAEFERLLMGGASDTLAKFIEAERREERLRDDDVAVVLLSVKRA